MATFKQSPGGYGADASGFTSGLEALSGFLSRAPGNVHRQISAAMITALNDLRGGINANMDRNFYKSTGGPFQKTGRKFTQFMRNSLKIKTKSSQALNLSYGDTLSAQPFSIEGLVGVFGLIYARVHEFGAVIVPRRKKFLTIPMQPEYVGHGAREFDLHAVFKRGSKSGRLIDERGDTAYLLLKRVELPARPFITPAFVKYKPKLDKNIKASVDTALNDSKGGA